MLKAAKLAWNECSQVKFEKVPKNSIVDLHAAFYKDFRAKHPEIPADVVGAIINDVLSIFRTIKANKHKIDRAPIKTNLSIRLTKNTLSKKNGVFRIISLGKRIRCTPYLYPKLQEYLEQYPFCDPLLFIRDNEIWISLTFKLPERIPTNKLALGVDLGCRVNAATSEGNLYVDKKFNAEKRKLRYLKRKLRSASDRHSKKAKKHLKRLRRKEAHKNRNFTHHLTKKILNESSADVIVLEDLKSLKVKKHKYQNKNRISQVPLAQLREILTYKALLLGKQVITVSPSYTSQIDHRTSKRDGQRIGGRYIGVDKQLLHADVNAACNIVLRSKLPCSIGNYFAWQAVVKTPIVGHGTDKLKSY